MSTSNLDALLSGEPIEEREVVEEEIETVEADTNISNLDALLSSAGSEVIPTNVETEEERTFWEDFKYAFDKEGNFLTNTAAILESKFPLGSIATQWEDAWENVGAQAAAGNFLGEGGVIDNIVVMPEEVLGQEEWQNATPQERRDMAYDYKSRELEEVYGEYDPTAPGSLSGMLAKGILDPVNLLIPAGGSVKAAAGLGAAAGAGYSVSEDVARGRDIDWKKAAAVGAVSGVAGGTVKTVSTKIGNQMRTRAANRTVDKVQKAYDDMIVSSDDFDFNTLIESVGVSPEKLSEAASVAGRKVKVGAVRKKMLEDVAQDSAVQRTRSPGLDRYLGTLSTRIRNISEPVFARIRKFEYDLHVETQNAGKVVEPWVDRFSKVPTNQKEAIARLLYNGKRDQAVAVMSRIDPKMGEDFQQVVYKLDALGQELKDNGHTFDLVENYFPRMVKDHEGLLNALGKNKASKLRTAMRQYADAHKIKSISDIPDWKKNEITNLVIRGYRPTVDKKKFSFAKPRVFDEIPENLTQFYAPPEESIHKYIRGAINDIQKRKLLGKGVQRNPVTGQLDLDNSIGKMISEGVDNGEIPDTRADELSEMLRARLINGESGMGRFLGTIRSTGYMTTIGNAFSAITQFGDLAVSGALKGGRYTLMSMFGTKHAKLIDIGLDDVITEELSDPSVATRSLNWVLRYGSGFKWVDRLGKETYINAAWKKSKGMVRSQKGRDRIRQKWGKVFGGETDNLIRDLESGNLTENVKLMLFNELSDIQPVSLSEMPEAYLNNPNGRVFYMLKSFALKQYDIVRREIVQEFRTGDKKEAVKNAARLWGFLAIANGSTQIAKDILMGREVRPEDIPANAMWALLGVYGGNKYMSDKYFSQGDIAGAAGNLLMPPLGVLEVPFQAGIQATNELSGEDADWGKVVRPLPVVGPIFYNWLLGGAEKFNERQDQE
jgi:hypothetical protein